mmetsp:Transcript_26923/g.53711  ORF Transcript_26923/g.53711 Transcript_26923/m.53711 type:complete len:213 (-) Transcript_26923:166-804(-)
MASSADLPTLPPAASHGAVEEARRAAEGDAWAPQLDANDVTKQRADTTSRPSRLSSAKSLTPAPLALSTLSHISSTSFNLPPMKDPALPQRNAARERRAVASTRSLVGVSSASKWRSPIWDEGASNHVFLRRDLSTASTPPPPPPPPLPPPISRKVAFLLSSPLVALVTLLTIVAQWSFAATSSGSPSPSMFPSVPRADMAERMRAKEEATT